MCPSRCSFLELGDQDGFVAVLCDVMYDMITSRAMRFIWDVCSVQLFWLGLGWCLWEFINNCTQFGTGTEEDNSVAHGSVRTRYKNMLHSAARESGPSWISGNNYPQRLKGDPWVSGVGSKVSDLLTLTKSEILAVY